MYYIKALHIIFVVTWFAGLFYIVRLFIYHVEAEEDHEKKGDDQSRMRRDILQTQYKIMEKRLWYGITWPSAVLTAVFGFWLLIEMNLWRMPYMHLKLLFVFFLYAYHFSCQVLFNRLQSNRVKYTSSQLRIWNEVATLFLVSIVFIIVLKNTLDWVYGAVGLVLFGIMLTAAIKIYKRIRTKE